MKSSSNSEDRRPLYPILIVFATLVGFGLRLVLLDRFPFREDEAIYSFWALHLRLQDPLLLQVWPDKPPLFLWFLSGTYWLLGASETSGRWLNIAVSTLTIPLLTTTARHLWGKAAGVVTGTTFALNPFAISFSPTVYTDPFLIFAGSLAFHLVVIGGRPIPKFSKTNLDIYDDGPSQLIWQRTNRPIYDFFAGLGLGIAIMTKQQGLLYTPLIFGIILLSLPPTIMRHLDRESTELERGIQNKKARKWRAIHPFLFHWANRTVPLCIGMALIILPILYWDSLRWSVAPSPWDLGIRNYRALTFVPPDQWPQRLLEWGHWLWYLTASWPAWIAILLGITWSWITKQRTPIRPYHPVTLSPHHLVILSPFTLLLIWSLFFLVLHITTTIQPWDRYLLPLAPIIALTCGWFVRTERDRGLGVKQIVLSVLFVLLLLPSSMKAAQGKLPLGGDHGAYAGLHEALDWLTAESSGRIILYHRVLGWHYRFYLYDRVEQGDTELRWFPHVVYLADNASKVPHRRKFLLSPQWAPLADLERHLKIRGLTLEQRFHREQFRVLEIVQPSRPSCDWCYSLPEKFP